MMTVVMMATVMMPIARPLGNARYTFDTANDAADDTAHDRTGSCAHGTSRPIADIGSLCRAAGNTLGIRRRWKCECGQRGGKNQCTNLHG